MTLFLRWALTNSLFGCGIAAARLAYHRPIHPAGLIAVAAVLALFAAGSGVLGWLAWSGRRDPRLLDDVAELVEALPAAAMLGTVAGFLIALSSSTGDVQHRAMGASTALVSTFVGIAAMLVLRFQHRLVSRHAPG